MPNLNDVAVDIIGVVTIWNLTHMYYNTTHSELGSFYKGSPVYLGYLGLGWLSTFVAIRSFIKYY
jgi:1,4-dihydroxy-2-naphthoate octaprenyltransferase